MSDPNDPMDGVERRLGELYRSADAEQPSAEIDRRILRAARDAAARRRRRWPLAALATAAAAVLAIAVLLRLEQTPVPQRSMAPAADVAAPPAESAREPAPPPARPDGAVIGGLAPSPRFRPASAPAAVASYAAPDCPEPHPLPAGAVIRAAAGGIEVVDSEGNVRFTLRCRNGRWEREPGPGTTQADDQP